MSKSSSNHGGRGAGILFSFLLAAPAFAQCPFDRIYRAGFDAEPPGLSLAGVTAGISAGTVELRSADTVLASTYVHGGIFLIEMPELAPATMLELRARGTGAEGFVELASHLGRAGHLADVASVDGVVRVTDLPAAGLRSRLLVEHAMLEQAHPGDPAEDECELATRIAALDQDEVARRAAIVQIVAGDGAIPAAVRGGVATTFDLVRDPVALAAAAAAIDADDPTRIAATITRMAESICQRFVSEAFLIAAPAYSGDIRNLITGELLHFQVDGGESTLWYGRDAFSWSCGAGGASFVFAGTRHQDVYASGPPPDNATFVGEGVLERYRIEPVEVLPDRVLAVVRARHRDQFPDIPELPDRISESEGFMAIPRLVEMPPAVTLPIPGEFVLPTSGPTSSAADADNSANRVRLDAGGGGVDLDANLPLAWSVDAAGRLQIVFQDRTASVIPLRADSPSAFEVMAVVENASGAAMASFRGAVKYGSASFLDVPERVTGTFLQNAGFTSGTSHHRYEVAADRSAQTSNTVVLGPDAGQTFLGTLYHWSVPAPREVVFRMCWATTGFITVLDREPAPGECSRMYQRRSWEVLVTEGEDARVLEHHRVWRDGATLGDPPFIEYRRPMLYRREAGP